MNVVLVCVCLCLWQAVITRTNPVYAEPLRIVAASQIRLIPRFSDARDRVIVRVRVTDDRAAPVRGDVALRVANERGLVLSEQRNRTSTDGRTEFSVNITPDRHFLEIEANFLGNATTAPSTDVQRVDLSAPFVALEVTAPATVDLATESSMRVRASVRLGELNTANVSVNNWPITLHIDNRQVAETRVNDRGNADFTVGVDALGAPGVHRVWVEHTRETVRIRSDEQRVVLRVPTQLVLLLRTPNERQFTFAGALGSLRGGVGHAPIRLVSHGEILAATTTDQNGQFQFQLDPAVIARPDVVVKAVFTPSEPWYGPSESGSIRLTASVPRQVSWWQIAAPLLVGMLVAGIVVLVKRKKAVTQPAPVRDTLEPVIERISVEISNRARVILHVVDAVTLAPLSGGECVWNKPALGSKPADEPVDVPINTAIDVTVTAPGYAPKVVRAKVQSGEYSVRVGVRTWREELFDRIRPWLRSNQSEEARRLPTPREALEKQPENSAAELVHLVESGVYGPLPPSEHQVKQAEGLIQGLQSTSGEQGNIDASN